MPATYSVINVPDRLQVASALFMPGARDRKNALSFQLNDNREDFFFQVWIDGAKCLNDDHNRFELTGEANTTIAKRLAPVIVEIDFIHNQGFIRFLD